ncbi:DnaJ-domain-containing protein [Piedraia hortae CBS 480.64]|uniref:DnaJ-domain-containing protein n=1 Tax=Piedraia hortae CBS 480.64 TaxID=1314780 RepID=A0A6A7C9K3_9PEZI|nr:DnaJ-domain-containing protein [Piedraia hortae CBS 480.64]
MGASQSSDRGEVQSTEAKISYYRLLDVDRYATDEDLKRAYRKKALELHPDRNYGNEAHATRIFAEVQAAYEVLSDPQERAWYDSHEATILGHDGAEGPIYQDVRVTTANDLTRLVTKFNHKIEFTDAPSGFYGFLRDTFDHLIKEEEAAGGKSYPSFGHKEDAYDDVVRPFYSAWHSFSTAKSFSWEDKWRLSEAPDRWSRRRMEQENKKARLDAIREFNEAVRSLVAFVRKRDPRYTPIVQSEVERQQALRDAAAAQAARARAANEERLKSEVLPEWAKQSLVDPDEGNFDEDDETRQEIECVACNKIFKSEKQWLAHERSKKHQKAIVALRKKMVRDDEKYNLGGAGAGDIDEELADKIEDMVLEGSLSEESEALQSEPSDAEEPGQCDPDEPLQPGSNDEEPPPPPSPGSEPNPGPNTAKPVLGKAAQKRLRKAAATSSSPNTSIRCLACSASFPTRTQLFRHLEDVPSHAALKSSEGKSGKNKKKGKRR